MADNTQTPVFDWEAGDFATDLQGAVIVVTEAEAVEQIIIKAIQTIRGVFLIYANEDDPALDHKYGNDAQDTLRQDMTEAAKISELARNIREALIYDPFIIDVTDIVITKAGSNYALGSCLVDHIYGQTSLGEVEL